MAIFRSRKKNGNGNGKAKPGPSRRRFGNGGRRGMRTNGSQVLAQGVAAAPRKAFGDSGYCTDMRVWDAKMPQHLALPRAIGPYTTIRITKRILSSAEVNILGPAMNPGSSNYEASWTNWACMSDVNPSLAMNGVNNMNLATFNIYNVGHAFTFTPAAFSVQIMNPGALVSTSGIVYAGVMTTRAAFAGDSRTWHEAADQFVEFQNPRLLSAGKLALRGVQINSYPLSMSQVSEFTTMTRTTDGAKTWNTSGAGAQVYADPAGWAPIMVYNTGGPGGLQLELLITMEMRVRFDLENPACASHSHHGVASDQLWDRLMRQATALGNGVIDIADVVANAGQLAAKYAPAAKQAMAALA